MRAVGALASGDSLYGLPATRRLVEIRSRADASCQDDESGEAEGREHERDQQKRPPASPLPRADRWLDGA
jgi:hypothetical protein